jgi:hypothetical protein
MVGTLISLVVLAAKLTAVVMSVIAAACFIKWIVGRINRPSQSAYGSARPRAPYRLELTRHDGSKHRVGIGMTWKEAAHCRKTLLEIGTVAEVEITHDPLRKNIPAHELSRESAGSTV